MTQVRCRVRNEKEEIKRYEEKEKVACLGTLRSECRGSAESNDRFIIFEDFEVRKPTMLALFKTVDKYASWQNFAYS